MSAPWKSQKLVLWALGVEGFDGRVLGVLAAHANIDSCQTWVGQHTIAQHIYGVASGDVVKWQVQKVSKAVNRMADKGLLNIARNEHRCADGTFTNLYTLAYSPRSDESPHLDESPRSDSTESSHLDSSESSRSDAQTSKEQRGSTKSMHASSGGASRGNSVGAGEASTAWGERFGVDGMNETVCGRMLEAVMNSHAYADGAFMAMAIRCFREWETTRITEAKNPAGWIVSVFPRWVEEWQEDIEHNLANDAEVPA